MKRTVTALTLVAFAAHAAPAPLMLGEKLVVHEWGTFTTVPGDDGDAIPWRPLAWKSDLPSFVHTLEHPGTGLRVDTSHLPPPRGKGERVATVRMETPVLYFYPDRERDVSVRVDFRGGVITEWYPFADTVGGSIDWGTVHLMPGWHPPLIAEAAKSHYYPAREAGASTVRVCGEGSRVEVDNMLFYRGVGYFQSGLKVRVAGENVLLEQREGHTIGTALVFERRGNAAGVTVVRESSSRATARRPGLAVGDGGVRALVREQLLAAGLYEREASAMLSRRFASARWSPRSISICSASRKAASPLSSFPATWYVSPMLLSATDSSARSRNSRASARAFRSAASARSISPRYS